MDAPIGAAREQCGDRPTGEFRERRFESPLNRFSPGLSLRTPESGSVIGNRQLETCLHRRCSCILNNKLDQDHRRRVTTTWSQLGNPGVSTIDFLIPGSNHIKQSLDRRLVIQPGHCESAMMPGILPGDGDQLFHHAPKFLGLGLGCCQAFILYQGNGKLSEQRLALAWVAPELASRLTVPHSSSSSSLVSAPSSEPPSEAIASAASRVSESSTLVSLPSARTSASPDGTRPASVNACRSSFSERGPKLRIDSSSSGSIDSTWPTFSICLLRSAFSTRGERPRSASAVFWTSSGSSDVGSSATSTWLKSAITRAWRVRIVAAWVRASSGSIEPFVMISRIRRS